MIDAFRIGVHIAMSSNSTQVLASIASEMTGIHISAQKLQESLGRIGTAAAGAGLAVGGLLVMKGTWHTVEAARELNRELDRTAQLGGKLKIDPQLVKAEAFKVSKEVQTSDPAGNVKLERELAGQVGSHEKAFQLLPFAARLAWNLQEYTGAKSEDAIKAAVKVADLRGNIFSNTGKDGAEEVDVGKLEAEMDAMARGIKASGGLLKPSDYLQFARQSGLAGKDMDPYAFYGMATEAMVSLGASKAGTATGSLFQQFQAGTAPAHDWAELAAKSGGMIKAGRDYTVEKGGHVKVTDQGRKDLHLNDMKKNEFTWINDFLIPMLEKGGVAKDQMLAELANVLGRQTTMRLVGEAYQNKVQFARTADLFQNAENVDDSSKMLSDKDLDTNIQNLQSAWTGFMQAMGSAGVPAAIEILHQLTDGIHYLTDLVLAHPEAATRILEFSGGLGAIMTVLGGAAIVGAAISALGVLAGPAGLLALAAGIVALGKAIPSFPSWMTGTLAGAASGAAIGSVIPGIGTFAGAAIGGGLGNLGLGTAGGYARDLLGFVYGGPYATPQTPWQIPKLDTTAAGTNTAQPGTTVAVTVNSTTNLDGKVLTKAVNKINAQAAGGQFSGGSAYNQRATMPVPAAVGAY